MEWATKKDFDEAKVPRETVTLWNSKRTISRILLSRYPAAIARSN